MRDGSTTTNRDSRLDVARGVAIVGIVLVHVFRGLYSAEIVDSGATILVDQIVGFWSLSVFAFVGGTFVPRGVRKRGVPGYIRDRVVQFFVVYVIWTLLQGGVQLLASSAVNTPPSVAALFSLWRPLGQLWYLPFLILVTVVFVPMKPWVGGRAPWILGFAAVISIAFWGFDGGYVGTQGLGLVVFFVAGMVIGSESFKTALDRFSPAVAAAVSVTLWAIGSVVAIFTGATGPTIFWDGRTVATVAIGVAVALATSAAALLFGQAARTWSWLALLGRRSLEIYLAHIIMASGTRIVLVQLGVTTTWVIVVACLLAGVIGSVAVAFVLRRIGLGWVFDGPGWLISKPPPSTPRQGPPAAGQG